MPRVARKSKGFTVQQLVTLLSPFKVLCSRHNLSARYKTLLLKPDCVVGMSSYGALEVAVTLLTDQEYAVDAGMFLALLDNLPKAASLAITLAGEGVLAWTCGRASGKLARAVLDKPFPSVSELSANMPKSKPWSIPDDFFTALSLGALSCQGNNTLASVNLYGVVLDNREGLACYSSDNTTLSYYRVSDKSIKGFDGALTLPPEGSKVLAELCKAHDGEITFGPNELVLNCLDGTKYFLKKIPPLKKDLSTILEQFLDASYAAVIPPDAISSFIRRVAVISETKKDNHVTLTLSEGNVRLFFAEGTASSEESYLLEGLENTPNIEGIQLSAEKLARALSKVHTMIFDYADREILVFNGMEGAFRYIVCGRKVL